VLQNLRGSGPLDRHIYHALKSDIGAGRLPPSVRLPSTRALAADLGVSRNTVMFAPMSSSGPRAICWFTSNSATRILLWSLLLMFVCFIRRRIRDNA